MSHLGHKVTTWVSRDHGDHLGQIQVITGYYLGQSYHLGRNIFNILFSFKADFLSWQKLLATIFFQKKSVK